MKYTVKISPRAKLVRLKVSPQEGLIVVVPKRFDLAKIPAILEKKKGWIQKFLDLFKAGDKLPEQISLRAIGQEWAVEYRRLNVNTVLAVENSEKLVLVGAVDRPGVVKAALHRWLALKAHEHLAPWLSRLAKEHQFPLKKIRIKSQKTCWGSCSSKHAINLNLRLLFLDPAVVQYVLLHELAHTRELNHSARFWAHVEAVEPRFRQLRAALRHAGKLVPTYA